MKRTIKLVKGTRILGGSKSFSGETLDVSMLDMPHTSGIDYTKGVGNVIMIDVDNTNDNAYITYGIESIHASCTWGDGPDVILALDNKRFMLYEDPSELHRGKHGFVHKGSLDLTADEAIKLGNELISSAEQAKDLDTLAKDHDSYADLFDKSLNGCKKEGKCCGKHKVTVFVHDEIKGGEDVRIERTRDEAISYQKKAAFRAKGLVYDTDQRALDDYIEIHQAIEDAPHTD